MSDAQPLREFWLGDCDPAPLALYRMGFGALLCFECLTRLPHAAELYSSAGFHLGALASTAPPPLVAYVVVLATALASLALAAGFRTRVASLVTLALWGWLYGIDQINERSLHSIALVVLATLALSDAGADFSLDARRTGARERVWATPLRLLQLQFAQVYFFAGLVKIFAGGWPTGSVLALSLSSRWATDAGLWIARHTSDMGWRVLALATILFEVVGPFLLFARWARPWVIALGLALHLGIQVSLGVGWLGFHFMVALVTLYPDAATLRRVVTSSGRRTSP